MKHTPKTLRSICEGLKIPCPADQESLEISGVATLEEAAAGDISFLSNLKYAVQAQTSQASAIFIKKNSDVNSNAVLIECEDPYMTFTMYLTGLEKEIGGAKDERKKAFIADDAILGNDCIIEAGAIIASGAIIGDNCRIGAGTKILSAVRLGNRVVVEAGAVIGSQGFGFAPDKKGVYHAIPQLGKVVIEDDVFIGANTTVDRGAISDTRIGQGTKIDNQCMIAHGVSIGKNTVIAAQTGVAGSTLIGDDCKFGGQVGIIGHLKIGNNVTIYAQSGVMHDVPDNKVIFGSPALDRRHFLKSFAAFKKQGL
ncbi:MAG TPA: UDP-3-O-(3-hydroxymyristoyl)glucosamine N-acyltransferase [Cryomorphaceae bacterium]|nr:UDP-3-O-(3-hydroxymyristoyl)glucosamine N-acyltransferase [Cryomorphaceae bacterium]|tara:strand:- start:4918 stop:5850 length:933 start_codon:yes stop_codon:yes gene_type:complete